ncbi:MAG: hypothetical protein QOE08_1508 [Thermoleophilaceae bacterium]|nr:hypothetical protein [Thermoleophilaceae bacterium]
MPTLPASDTLRAHVARLWPGLLLGVAVLVVLQLARGDQYWNYSEGVYLLTSRMLGDGADLYGHVIASQPPPMFVVGAGLLAIHDSIEWMRVAMGLLQLTAGVLGAVAVWRLTASRAAAIVTVPVSLLTPWAVHEHGLLTPEMFAGPLLLGGALMAGRRDRAAAVGVLAALAASFKVPYVIPAVALVLVSADRRRTALWALGVFATGVAASFAVFGSGLWTDVVSAQLDSGRLPFSLLKGMWAQAGWNLIGLLVAVALAWRLRGRARDPVLFRAVAAVAAGVLLTVMTNWKRGTGLNILVPVEATLVPLAMAGAAWGVESLREGVDRRARLFAAAAIAGVALAVVQGASLAIDPYPKTLAHPWLRPGSSVAWAIGAREPQVDAIVAAARKCPPGVAYSNIPYYAFLAERRMPGDQPDRWILEHSGVHRAELARVSADQPVCP